MTVKADQKAAVAKLQQQWDDGLIEVDQIAAMLMDGCYEGWCVECEEWTTEGIEPDVDFHPCPACGEHAVFAAEQILIYVVA